MGKYLSSTQFVQFAVHERVARVTLNRPDKRNALTGPMLDELHSALLEADARADVNVIILQGAGKDFCAGYDLAGVYAGRKSEEQQQADDASPVSYRTLTSTLDDDCWNLERTQDKTLVFSQLHKPVIARVQGNCLAGGTDLALMCDMVIAAEDARIGFPATRANGTPPNHMWVYHVGPQWAKRLLMTGDALTGRDAARIGLVLDAVPVA
jgi:enoyl-CoA hydratase